MLASQVSSAHAEPTFKRAPGQAIPVKCQDAGVIEEFLTRPATALNLGLPAFQCRFVARVLNRRDSLPVPCVFSKVGFAEGDRFLEGCASRKVRGVTELWRARMQVRNQGTEATVMGDVDTDVLVLLTVVVAF